MQQQQEAALLLHNEENTHSEDETNGKQKEEREAAACGEQLYNFLCVPWRVERLVATCFLVYLDAFLYGFCVLPLRCAANFVLRTPKDARQDLKRLLLVVLPAAALTATLDVGRLYHAIRGQSIVKLYAIFNVFEVADRLCVSFGYDCCMHVLGGSSSRSDRHPAARKRLSAIVSFVVCTFYVLVHACVLLLQFTAMNVAVNSYSEGLKTLIVSNQFVEIKSTVFRRLDAEALFGLATGDALKRFTLCVYCAMMAARNVSECSLRWLTVQSVWHALIAPIATIFVAEFAVDWLKHAFVARLNGVPAESYDAHRLQMPRALCRDAFRQSLPLFRTPLFPLAAVATFWAVDVARLWIGRVGIKRVAATFLFLWMLLFAMRIVSMRLLQKVFLAKQQRRAKCD